MRLNIQLGVAFYPEKIKNDYWLLCYSAKSFLPVSTDFLYYYLLFLRIRGTESVLISGKMTDLEKGKSINQFICKKQVASETTVHRAGRP